MKDYILCFFSFFMRKLQLRFDQEMMVLRYVFFCKPSLKTVVVFLLRLCILMVSAVVFYSILVSFSFFEYLYLNVVFLLFFLTLFSLFLWEFGYTLKHLKRYSMLLVSLMLLPLPFYFLIYADTIRAVSLSSVSIQSSATGSDGSSAILLMDPSRVILRPNASGSSVDDSNVEFALVGKPLNFPNPCRASLGTKLGFALTKPDAIEIQIYNMLGRLVCKKSISKDELISYQVDATFEGAQYYHLPISPSDIRGDFSAGAYFYLIIHDDKVVGKGKMAVVPG